MDSMEIEEDGTTINKHNILTQCNWQAKNTGFENY